jgi:UDP-N-acetylglucosamine 2-epimerase (non-hydrolysing)
MTARNCKWETCCVVGARPNFMKMAPIVSEFRRRGWPIRLVHTGQHYDKNMSEVFFEHLEMPNPDVFLNVGSDSHARQTARIMTAFDDLLRTNRPRLVVVAGDVNSTVAAALVAAKEGIPVAHIEAGLRSFDRSMPEEINRIVTDHLSDLLFTTEESANDNLRMEGISTRKIHFVGNCMIDSLKKHQDRAIGEMPWKRFGLSSSEYILVTLHRPANVDDSEKLGGILSALDEVSRRLPVLFPMHPRTRDRLNVEKIECKGGVLLCDPLPYRDFLGLMARARIVLTDSGGIQEETTALNVTCLTLRHNTERPATEKYGSNRLVGTDPKNIVAAVGEVLSRPPATAGIPPLWDGQAAVRVCNVLNEWFC